MERVVKNSATAADLSSVTRSTAYSPHVALHVLMIVSGFAGLGYEMVWTRSVSVALGHEIVAVLAVVVAFFFGLALGAYFLDSRIRRSESPRLWYAGLEMLIGAWALTLIFLLPAFSETMAAVIGTEPSPLRHWSFVFFGTALLFLPASCAMGATLPAMERVLAGFRNSERGVASLYAANTFGAVMGTLLTTLLIVPWLGLTLTLVVLAATNFCCAFYVLAIPSPERPPPPAMRRGGTASDARLAATLAATGFLGIGYEVIVIRMLSQVLENTVYTFATLLSVYLLGTAMGAALYARFAPRENFEGTLALLLQALTLSCCLGVALLWLAPQLHLWLTEVLGNGYLPAITGEFLLALLIFLLPTVFMGATFSHLAQAARDSLGLGRALGLNTLAGAAAPFAFGIAALPIVGSKALLIATSVAYLLLMPGATLRPVWRSVVPAAAAIALALIPAPLRVVGIPDGGEILSYDEGVMASVSVVRDANDVRYLKVNNHFTMGSSASRYSDRRQTHIPFLLHPNPQNALFLGVGTGATFVTVVEHADVSATGVELIPEILPTLEYFGPSADAIQDNNRLRLVTSDARRFVRATDEMFDVVVGEVFHPSRDGSGSLYTVEHFDAISERLNEHGLYCQWLPLFQLDLDTLRTIVRTFTSVFPDTEAYLAHYSLGQPLVALVGRQQHQSYHRGWIRDRVTDRHLALDLESVAMTSDFDLFGGFLGNAEALADFAGEGPLNTDDRPVVTYEAPGFVYAAPEPAAYRLLTLLEELKAEPDDLLDSHADDPDRFAERIANYWRARNAYLAAGVDIVPSTEIDLLLARLREPMLEIVGISEDFTPAYRPLVELSYELSRSDETSALSLLDEIIAIAPNRPEARQLRQQLAR